MLDPPEGLAYPTEIGRAESDDTGRIRVDVPRTSSSNHDAFGVVALRRVLELAGSRLMPTPNSRSRTLRFPQSKSSTAACLTSWVSPRAT